ncbi:DUF4249 family protein [Arcticibacter tournemirensis]|uniref:DUF4249 family protein n=1 Tax=Arcticibacter tournemirensis TaxID=699437 RepID=A0A4Q0M8G5_9SPHI|nr:DUF4249 family protein [Arcticibacter tournemirensis]RXF69089.1 DUF4249 family protein [Arcticibacter tournemirensis]
MRRFTILPVVFLWMLLSNCGKDDSALSFNTPRNIYDLAVEGGINTYTKTQYIRLSKPAFHPDSLPKPISDAHVEVNDGSRNIAFSETSVAGVYSGIIERNNNYNQAYKLTIRYNNKEYTASDTLRQVVNIIDDFIPLSVVRVSGDKVKITIPKHTFGYLNPSRWMIAYSGIPFWNPSRFEEMLYYSYTHSRGSPNSQYPLTDQNRESELPQDGIITIYKFSLSENYARYLYSLFQETEWRGVFSGTPARARGNITGNAEGYFSVTDVDMRRYRAGELVR